MLNTILNHRSIRKFKKDAVPNEILQKILSAASMASTTGNMQVYSIVVTTDPTIKKDLWEAHFKQGMVLEAPMVITFCADFNRFNKWCEQREAKPGYDNFLSFFTGAIDALLAAQNLCLAAEEQGLGICYLGTTTYMSESIINILDLPRSVMPVTTIAIGYPESIPELTERLPLEAIVHYEKYKDFEPSDIDSIYKAREASEQTQELLKVNQKETLAQIFTDKRYTKSDNITFSREMLFMLEKQGFMNNEQSQG